MSATMMRRAALWDIFKNDVLRPALGVLVTVPIGVGIAVALATLAGWV
jgi:hypothetical protein